MYIEEIIGEDYMNWQNGQVFLFGTPTGTGKTTFFEGRFLNFALASGKRVLYLTNRVMLCQQMIQRQFQRIIKRQMETKSFWQNFLPKEEEKFYIGTYQQLEYALVWNNFEQINFFKSFDILICDESHYFIADSTFNTNTILSFKFVIENYRNKQLFFLTATDRNFLGVLTNYLNRTTKKTDLFVEGMFPGFQRLHLQPDYQGVYFSWFYRMEDIEKIIAEITDQDKSIIFVSSIKEGKAIKKILNKVLPVKDSFLLSSESAQTEAGKSVIQQIEKDQYFSMKVLITTAKMDSGVNIIDKNVKHVFLMQNNEESTVQMLGRRRRESDETVNVYLFARSRDYFASRCNQMRFNFEYINYVCKYKAEHANDFDAYIAYEFLNEKKAEVLRKFLGVNRYTKAEQRYFVNWLSIYRMQQLYNEYEAIIRDFDTLGPDAYIIRQAYWLGVDMKTLKISKPRTYVQNIEEFILNFVGTKMQVEDFDAFRIAFMPLLHVADNRMFPKMTEKASWTKINTFFAQNDIPFVIVRNLKKKNSSEGRSYEIKVVEQGMIYE